MPHLSPDTREKYKSMIQDSAENITKNLKKINLNLEDHIQPHHWMDQLVPGGDCLWAIPICLAMKMLEEWVLLARKCEFHLINPELMARSETRLKQMKDFSDPNSGRGWVMPNGTVPLGSLPTWHFVWVDQKIIRNTRDNCVWSWRYTIRESLNYPFEFHYQTWAATKIQNAFKDYALRDYILVD